MLKNDLQITSLDLKLQTFELRHFLCAECNGLCNCVFAIVFSRAGHYCELRHNTVTVCFSEHVLDLISTLAQPLREMLNKIVFIVFFSSS